MTRASRYALFLSYVTEKLEQQSHSDVQISWNDWRLQMHQFYQKAFGIYLNNRKLFQNSRILNNKINFQTMSHL